MKFENLLNAAKFYPKSINYPYGWVGHLNFASWLISETKPKLFVELGSHSGNSYFSFCQAVQELRLATKCFAVDTWKGDEHSGGYGEDVYDKFELHNNQHYSTFSNLIRTSFDNALKFFEDDSIDLLHIDGLHTYDAVSHDFKNWLPKIAPGGLIIFHDTNVRVGDFGVWKLWEELAEVYKNRLEFHHSNGLGVLQVKCSKNSKKWDWLIPNTKEQEQFLEYFAFLGNSQLKLCEISELKSSLNARDAEISELKSSLNARDAEVSELKSSLNARDAEVSEIRNSTSWKMSYPIRILGRCCREANYLFNIAAFLFMNIRNWPRYFLRFSEFFKKDGFLSIKSSFLKIQAFSENTRFWIEYKKNWDKHILPKLIIQESLLPKKPLISVLMPTYNSNPNYLRQAIRSVQEQIYQNWELCIVDDASTDKSTQKIILDFCQDDPKIKINFLEINKGVSYATNRALDMACGDFIVLLDHDDILEKQALFRIAESILVDTPDFIYTDEVITGEDGVEVKQFVYRPSYSPEFIKTNPYIVHLIAFRASLLRSIDGLDEQLKISQDYDLILRVIEVSNVIVHIPEILYRWRTHNSSTGHQLMNQVMEHSKRILNSHLERIGESGNVEDGVAFNLFKVNRKSKPQQKVAIIIPTKDKKDLLEACVNSIKKTLSVVSYDIYIINHESKESCTLDYLNEIASEVKVLEYEGDFNFSVINNWAVSKLPPIYTHFLFCNNDIEAIENNWLDQMLMLFSSASVGVVGPMLLYADRSTIQHAGVCVGMNQRAEHYGKFYKINNSHIDPGYRGAYVLPHEVSAVTAACLLVKKELFESVGGFDESMKVGFGDVDFCLKILSQGYSVIFTPEIKLIHHESQTRGISYEDNHPNDTKIFVEKWGDVIRNGDFFYNKGLSLESTFFEYKLPLEVSEKMIRRVCRKELTDSGAKHFYSYSLNLEIVNGCDDE